MLFVHIVFFFIFVLCRIVCLYVLSYVMLGPFLNDVQFFFTSNCWLEVSYLIYIICVCFRIVRFCFVCLRLVSYVPYIASFSELSIFDCTFSVL